MFEAEGYYVPTMVSSFQYIRDWNFSV